MRKGDPSKVKGFLHEGCPNTEMRGRSFHINCGACPNSSDLSDPVCFMSAAAKLPPGFSGEVVLNGPIDRSYSGPLVEGMTAASEVLDRLEGLIELARGTDRSLLVKGKRERAAMEAKSRFVRDPTIFMREKDEIERRLSPKGEKDDGAMNDAWDDVVRRTDLMLRKMDLLRVK